MLTLKIEITGDNESDLDDALDEVKRLVGDGYKSAPWTEGDGKLSFSFNVDGEETLPSTLNTAEIEDRVTEAFRASSYCPDDEEFQTDFEHGGWWVSVKGSGAQYRVVDAEGGDSIDGFDFEIVTEPEEE